MNQKVFLLLALVVAGIARYAFCDIMHTIERNWKISNRWRILF